MIQRITIQIGKIDQLYYLVSLIHLKIGLELQPPKLNLSGFHFTEIEAYEAMLANAISFIIAFSKKVKKIWLKVVGASSVNLPIEKFS